MIRKASQLAMRTTTSAGAKLPSSFSRAAEVCARAARRRQMRHAERVR